MTDAPADELARSRAETRAAFANRALVYLHTYDVLAEELGPDRAAELMERAIHRRGLEVAERYKSAAAARDLDAIATEFCDHSPCEGALFEPGVAETEDGMVVLRMTACPLVDAWRDHGVPEDKIDRLCEIAAAVDVGTFEGAGLGLTFLARLGQPGSDRCLLEVRLP